MRLLRLAAMSLLAVRAQGQCATELGMVAAPPVGGWFDRTFNKSVGERYMVCANSQLIRVSSPINDPLGGEIRIRTRRGEKVFLCRAYQDCANPLPLGELLAAEQQALKGAGFFQSFFAFLSTYKSAMSHSSTGPEGKAILQPAIVASNSPIDASEVFRAGQARAGTYLLNHCPKGEDSACRSTPVVSHSMKLRTMTSKLPFLLGPGVHMIFRLDEQSARRTQGVIVMALPEELLREKATLLREGTEALRQISKAVDAAKDDMERDQLKAFATSVANRLWAEVN